MKGIVLVLALGCATVRADPVFDFSWTSVGLPYELPAGVVITGQIFGLPDNGSGPASDIVVDSITGVTPDPSTIFSNLPVDLMSAGCQVSGGLISNDNAFVVQNDVITSASFFCQDSFAYDGAFGFGTGTLWAEYLSGGILYPAPPDFAYFEPRDGVGFMGTATFSLAPVPEPSYLAIVVLAMSAAITAARRHRKSATSMRSIPSSSICVK